MNVSLTRELEKVVEGKVKSGFYNDASEVVRDALRRAFTEIPVLDLEQDTPELAALVRQGRRSRHVLHKRGDIRKMLAEFHSQLGR